MSSQLEIVNVEERQIPYIFYTKKPSNTYLCQFEKKLECGTAFVTL